MNAKNTSTPIINIVSYSYKGGSGRSTASVNIAFKLARMGKLVACVDMDIGAAGLHMILSEWDKDAGSKIGANAGVIGHQDFFNAPRPDEQVFKKLDPAMLMIADQQPPSEVRPEYLLSTSASGGKLLFLFSSTQTRVIADLQAGREEARRFEEKYKLLQRHIAQRLREDVADTDKREVYIIVDAPNGITPVSLPLLRSADLILMFYRHSLQHIQGSIEAGRKLHDYLMEEFDRRFMRILLIGSCVPERLVSSLLKLHSEKTYVGEYGKDMVEKFEGMRKALREFAEEYPGVVESLQDSIIEDDVLKVLEQPLTDEHGVRNEYLGYPPPAADVELPWDVWSSERTNEKIQRIADNIAKWGTEVLRRKHRTQAY